MMMMMMIYDVLYIDVDDDEVARRSLQQQLQHDKIAAV